MLVYCTLLYLPRPFISIFIFSRVITLRALRSHTPPPARAAARPALLCSEFSVSSDILIFMPLSILLMLSGERARVETRVVSCNWCRVRCVPTSVWLKY